jgi:hypothetical protein
MEPIGGQARIVHIWKSVWITSRIRTDLIWFTSVIGYYLL